VEKCRKDSYSKEDYYCFIGRLSHEKGIKTLIESANSLPYKLVIIGGGPLEEEAKAQAGNKVEFVGFKQWEQIKEIVGKARFSVIPSECYENNPLSVIEAQCLGTPVLGARIGGIPELIEEGVSGMTFESRNVKDLKEKIESMFATSFDYRVIAESSQRRYNAENYYNQIVEIYK
jgi:glycosyltransferase involved in cell wall biosynthesis